MDRFEVTYNGEPVGSATVEKQGLYYAVACRCKMLEGVLRLMVEAEKGMFAVGVCIPDGDGIGICRKLPIKQLGTGPWRFVLSGGETFGEVVFVPLNGELPTKYLKNLEKARFQIREGQPGLVFPYFPEDA